jgi:hypothetical protein
MNINQRVNAFDFNYYFTFDDQIRAKTAIELYFIVNERIRFFLFDAQTDFQQFVEQTFLINRFKQSRAESRMNFHRLPNYQIREFIFRHLRALCVNLGEPLRYYFLSSAFSTKTVT